MQRVPRWETYDPEGAFCVSERCLRAWAVARTWITQRTPSSPRSLAHSSPERLGDDKGQGSNNSQGARMLLALPASGGKVVRQGQAPQTSQD